uniref:BTB domain-containing protein n=1 Tax=Heterorhabditis bacteriophora TaxID=37862 RepID=A0A1I7XLL1_HETBA
MFVLISDVVNGEKEVTKQIFYGDFVFDRGTLMSDSHVNLRHPALRIIGCGESGSYGGEVDHTAYLSDNIGSLYLNQDFSDVLFIVDGEKFPAHKVLLAARSDYFRAMLYGGMKESDEGEIILEETSVFAFRVLLKYIYTAKLTLLEYREDQVMDILGLAHKYGFIKLQNAVADYLKAILNNKNLCHIFNISQLYMLHDLTEYCLVFADQNASEVLSTQGFLQLSLAAVTQLISRDSFCAPEIDIFSAIKEWVKVHPEVNNRSYSYFVPKFLKLSILGLLAPDTLLDAIEEQSKKRTTDLTHRGFLTPNTNIATAQLGACVVAGESPNALLNEPGILHDGDRNLTRHAIGDDEGIIIQLGSPYIINKLILQLWDREQRMYSYYVEVSMDRRDWARVVDHTKYLCRSRQTLFFSSRVVRFIRIVGTHNSQSNRMFHLVSLEALNSSEEFEIDPKTMLLIPSMNVATIANNALVIEGVSRCRNALLNGQTSDYDWDNGYTCHQLGSGAITVQLPQPYTISSMRLLLWDCDDRYYSYYVEVSVNQQDWKKVTDRQINQCRGWQLLEFPAVSVVFIKIVGTHNSANEVFHCVHFECPASSDAPPVDERSVIPAIQDYSIENN